VNWLWRFRRPLMAWALVGLTVLLTIALVFYHLSEPRLALIPLIILLFPDGRLPSPRWRWAVGSYLALAVIDTLVQGQMSVYALTHHRPGRSGEPGPGADARLGLDRPGFLALATC